MLTPSDQPSSVYTPADITSILQRLRDSKPVTSSAAVSTSSWMRGNSPFQGHVRGGSNRRLNDVPSRARRAAGAYPINSRRARSSFGYRSAPPGSFDRSGYTAARSNNHQRGTENRLSIRGGTSDSPYWRGSGSAEDPLTIA